MWVYKQASGELLHEVDGEQRKMGEGYSGHGEGVNNPMLQDVPDVGPIPRGEWTIGAPYFSKLHGPYTMSLRPEPSTMTFGRSGFLIHGDNYHMDHTASRGCIILSRELREQIHESSDTDLEVI